MKSETFGTVLIDSVEATRGNAFYGTKNYFFGQVQIIEKKESLLAFLSMVCIVKVRIGIVSILVLFIYDDLNDILYRVII